ncbi:MAG: hemerythrin domain-containing protein [Nocardiopsaceae bacterium]|jgi:hemerythrin-like domain-containing protein|nr:hemerythrin domain-containing protein [Nocardiopsaceae bacterium]
MCEYCGCQALDQRSELTMEHEVVLRLISELRAAQASGDVAMMEQLARQIAAVLDPHTKVEEQGLFPALASEFPDQMADLPAEHRRVDAVLAEASAGPPEDPAWPDRLAGVLAVLRKHIFKEQDGVFPAALASLRTSDWEAIEAARAQAGSLLPGQCT